MKNILLLVSCWLVSFVSSAQCNVGEVEVELIVHTDAYGYEGYWQLVPNGSTCGTGVIAEGGNSLVGCGGAGAQAQAPGGYGNDLTINEGPWCLLDGATYDLIYTDDWGDGGFSFDIVVNGYTVSSFDGVGLGATFNFVAEEPPAYDLSVFGSNIYSYVTIGSYDLDAHIFNNGTTTINSFDLNYTINGGPSFTHSVTGASLANFQSMDVSHSIPINILSNGVYELKIWADNLNTGNADADNFNDTLTKSTEAGPGIPNYLDGYIGDDWINIVEIANASDQIDGPTDLDFHPVLTNMELWVCNKGTEASGGSTITIYDAGQVGQTSVYKQDGNAWHFMSEPTGIAFGLNGNWANSPGVYDANHNGGDAFTGPALWSSDMSVYAQPSGGNGSHLDMLHLSPYSQGIAAEKDNVYWVFDGYTNDLVRYDFDEDHGPGNSFHGDAIVRRYSDDALAKDPNDQIVSHLVMDGNLQWLYVVDHGNDRVIRIDINTGSVGGAPNYPQNEGLAEYTEYTGYTQEDVVTTGLSKPAGIDIVEDRMIVSEYESGDIILYDISTIPAVELERIPTGKSSVQGVKIGPDGRIWFVDYDSDAAYRIDGSLVGIEKVDELTFEVYPNPSNGSFIVSSNKIVDNAKVELLDLQGRVVYSNIMNGMSHQVEVETEAGIYFVKVTSDDGNSKTEKLIID